MGLVAYVDTNVLLRYIVRDGAAQTAAATALLESSSTLVLTPVTFAEVAHTLRSFYGLNREVIIERLGMLLALPSLSRSGDVLSAALDIHSAHNVELPDALLAAQAIHSGAPHVCSFDRDFDRIPGVERVAP